MTLKTGLRRLGLLAVLIVISAGVFAPASTQGAREEPNAQDALENRKSKIENSVVAYELTPNLTETPRLDVTMRFAVSPDTDAVDVQMPVWSPGDYHVQNFAQYVQDFHAWAGSPNDARPLPVTRPDANTWHIASRGAKNLTLTYALSKTPRGFFSENVQLQAKQIFVNGPAAYLYIMGRKDAPATLTLDLPAGWQAEMPLPATRTSRPEKAVFRAPDYDTLADSPLLAAPADALRTLTFTLNGRPHRAVFFGDAKSFPEPKTFTPTLTAIVQAECKIMGSPPYARYEWFFDVKGRGGGLEHLNSSRLALWAPQNPPAMAPFIAHEFFHLWDVKRIRPLPLGPFDYIHPPQTHNLWFAEGVTEYYAHIATRRAGIYSETQFLTHWKEAIEANRKNPKRLEISADDSSWRVWEAGNSEGYGISYYDKGELIGLCLDLKIRSVTKNRRSLDDVMHLLMQRCNPPKPGYGEDELREVVNEVAGTDLTDFYNLLARSTQEMPFAECLGYAGLDIHLNPLPDATPAQRTLRADWTK